MHRKLHLLSTDYSEAWWFLPRIPNPTPQSQFSGGPSLRSHPTGPQIQSQTPKHTSASAREPSHAKTSKLLPKTPNKMPACPTYMGSLKIGRPSPAQRKHLLSSIFRYLAKHTRSNCLVPGAIRVGGVVLVDDGNNARLEAGFDGVSDLGPALLLLRAERDSQKRSRGITSRSELPQTTPEPVWAETPQLQKLSAVGEKRSRVPLPRNLSGTLLALPESAPDHVAVSASFSEQTRVDSLRLEPALS